MKTNPNYSEESDAERHLRKKKKKQLLWCAGGVRFCPLVIKGPWLDNSQVQTWLRKQLGATHLGSLITTTEWWKPMTVPHGNKCKIKWKSGLRFFFFSPPNDFTLCIFRLKWSDHSCPSGPISPSWGTNYPPPPRSHVQIPRVLQRSPPWRSQRTVGQGDINCPLMRLFGMQGPGPAGQVSSRCFWRQRPRTESRVVKFTKKKKLLVERMSWFRGFAIFFFPQKCLFTVESFRFLLILNEAESPGRRQWCLQKLKKKLDAQIPLSGIGPDTGVEYSTRSHKIFAHTMTPISVVYVCRQQFCEICNCIAVKLATHVLEKSCWRICGEIKKKNQSNSTMCNGATPPPVSLSPSFHFVAFYVQQTHCELTLRSGRRWLRPLRHRWTPADCWEAQWLIGRCVDT